LSQALAAVEKTAEMINVPFLKGAVGLASIIVESARVSNAAAQSTVTLNKEFRVT
jgi:hypothetical protein